MPSNVTLLKGEGSTTTPEVHAFYFSAAPSKRKRFVKVGIIPVAPSYYYATQSHTQGTDSVLRNQFDGLANRWEKETAHLSSFSRRRNHSYFSLLLKIGSRSIPWVLERLKAGNPFWFLVLKEIAPNGPTEQWNGDMKKARAKWLEWGKLYGHSS